MDELEKLKKENEQLKLTIKSLQQQIENYTKQSRRRYDDERDYVPYHEYEYERE